MFDYRIKGVRQLDRINFAFLLNFEHHCELLLACSLALEPCRYQLVEAVLVIQLLLLLS